MKKIISVVSVCLIFMILQINIISYAEGTNGNQETSGNGGLSDEYLDKDIQFTSYIEVEKGTTVKDFIEQEKARRKKEWYKNNDEYTFGDATVYAFEGTTNREYFDTRKKLNDDDIVRTNVTIEITTYHNNTAAGEGEDVAVVVKGDLSGSGEVDVTSLSLMQQEIVEETELKGAFKEAADMNNDKEIDVLDLSSIQDEIVNN